jgi:diguanylate cyclase (GGDEF)-like protein
MDVVSFFLFAGSLSVICSSFLGVYALRRRASVPSALPFALLMLANALYSAVCTLEMNAPTLADAILCLKVEYVAVSMIPVFWLLFALGFAGDSRPLRPARFAALAIFPAIIVSLMWTNESHHLMFESLGLRDDSPLTVFSSIRGPLYWVTSAYLYSLLALGTAVVVAGLSRAAGRFRGQSLSLVAAVFLPWIGHALLLLNVSPYGIDLTPFLMAISGAVLSLGIFKYGMLDLRPVAREMVVDAMRDGVIVLDTAGRLVDANKVALAAFPGLASLGEPAADALGRLGIPCSGETELELELEGRKRWYRTTAVVIEDDLRERGTLVLVSDVTETKELLSRLERLASTDALTGVDNRRCFFEHAERELELARRRGSALSFAMMDLDHFKKVNDRHGHAAGDAALVAACDACRAALRSTDILCRYGGEEFMVILPDASPAKAMDILERVRRNIAALIVSDPASAQPFGLTVSIGLAGLDGEGGPFEDLEVYIRRSDEALYRAKMEGRNRVVVFAPAAQSEKEAAQA